MPMSVEPGGAYFGLYSDFGDLYRGEAVSYGTAVAAAAAAGTRDVTNLPIPEALDDWPDYPQPSHPMMTGLGGDGTSLEVTMTYDNGMWPGGSWSPEPSYFLVELQGPGAAGFEATDGEVPLGIYLYVSSDGGQYIYLHSTTGVILTALTNVRIWRVSSFPGDEGGEPEQFWTDFIGSRERP